MPVKAVLSFMFIALCPGLLFAKGAKSPAAEVENVLGRYRRAPAIEAKVKKTVVQEVMGTTNESQGRFYFSKGKLRLDMETPEKSTLVYDGRDIWLESRLDENTVEVSHLKVIDLRRGHSVMAALFDRRDALKKFKLLKTETKSGLKTFSFAPREKKNTEVSRLEIGLKAGDIRRISYHDKMENQVTFEFSDLNKGKVPAAKFKYRPPKNADVTEI
jgi:outer membrane lipoprotein-sorting protein